MMLMKQLDMSRNVIAGRDTFVMAGQQTITQLIKSLFSNGEQGFFYDPNDLTTMFQDAAGTIPVTAAGQPVGLVKDKSGRNNHAYQTTSAARPILRKNATTGAYYLAFDGVDDFLQTNNIDFTSTDEISIFSGVTKLRDSTSAILVELSATTLNFNGSFHIDAPSGQPLNNYGSASRGTTRQVARAGANYAAPSSVVINLKAKISSDMLRLSVNGILAAASDADQGAGNYGNYPLYIGNRGYTSQPFTGHIYGLIGIGKLTTDSETTTMEKELAKRVGVTLNV